MANVVTSFKKQAQNIRVGDHIGLAGWDGIRMQEFETVGKVIRIDNDVPPPPQSRATISFYFEDSGEVWTVDSMKPVTYYHVRPDSEPTPDAQPRAGERLSKLHRQIVDSWLSNVYSPRSVQARAVEVIVRDAVAEESGRQKCSDGTPLSVPAAAAFEVLKTNHFFEDTEFAEYADSVVADVARDVWNSAFAAWHDDEDRRIDEVMERGEDE